MNKSVLILGAGLMQGPAIRAAKELGYTAFVVDGNPEAVCASLADVFNVIDLKDRQALADYADLINKNASEGKNGELAAIFTAGTDFSASVAYVAEHCSLPGHSFEACLNASNKVRMRGCFAAGKVPSPDFEEVDSEKIQELIIRAEKNQISFPKVIKPVDNMGGRGCRLVRNKDELQEAVTLAVKNSRTSKAIFEDYMDGQEFSIDSIVYDGTLTITGFADRHIYYPPYFIETGHTMPSTVSEKVKNELIATFALGIKSLGLQRGVAKADIKYTARGPMIGEIAARLSGGYMSGWTFPYSSDCYLTKEALKVSLGVAPDFIEKNRVSIKWQPHQSVKDMEQPFELYELKPSKVSAERAWISIPGKIKAISGYEEAEAVKYVKDVLPRNKEGDQVNFPRNNVEKCGNVITCAQTHELAVSAACEVLSKITLRLEPHNKDTEEFLKGVEAPDEKGFPPSAFDVEVNWNKVKDIPQGQKISLFMPEEFTEKVLEKRDWNHCTLKQVISRFEKMCPDHKPLEGKTFWKACLRGSIQAMLYIADN